MNFPEWMEKYKAFRKVAGGVCSKDVPTEIAQLQAESQVLPRLQWAAGRHAAEAHRLYKEAQEKKASLSTVLWAREDSNNLLQVIKDRAFNVNQAIRLLNGGG